MGVQNNERFTFSWLGQAVRVIVTPKEAWRVTGVFVTACNRLLEAQRPVGFPCLHPSPDIGSSRQLFEWISTLSATRSSRELGFSTVSETR